MSARNSEGQPNWPKLAAALHLPDFGIIDGERRKAQSSLTFDCFNPATGEKLAEVAAFQEVDVDRAVQSARAAFTSAKWAGASPSERKARMLAFADLLIANAPSLALMDSLAMGKPAQIALDSDVPGAASFIRWYGECLDKLYDEVVPSAGSSIVTATREPLGVVAIMTPWNYPIEEAAIKLGPALAAGNSVLLKPSEISPFSAIRMGELALEAGFPPGVLNVVPGTGNHAGRALALHHDVDCVSFTGSSEVGKLLMRYSGDSNLKRVWLECGGKSPNLVFADCIDLDRAAAESARSVFRNQGQVCSAATRVLVERRIADIFVDRLVGAAADYCPADPLLASSRVGPMASPAQYRKVLDYIERGLDEGASLILDGRSIKGTAGRLSIGPTIFTNVRPEMRIARDEIFGPVLCVMTFDDENEAIRLANDSIYGLVASVWTGALARAHRVARALAVGSVTINGVDSQSEAAAFGGYKQSGIGREHSLHAFDQYTNLKTTFIHY
ncbi:MAG TPA: aldehyde dehydrogenase family protein [Sphingomicrobium sp.]|nr:aldehyde dehydrogenase family protein [Sphingomicrobium sp.]